MSATTTHLRQFNHYNEFRTPAGIDGVLHYINSGHVAVPPGLTPQQTLSFTLRFAPNSGFVSRIVHGQQQLFYNQNTFDLEVVRPENKEARMLVIFNDPASGYGVGLQAFFKQCAMRYLNIKKPDTDSFLHGQMNYNVAVKSKRQINKPLLTSYCSERYGCDLIDMSDFNLVLNASRRYIFVVGDYFSGMLWARGITNRMNTPANPTLSTALNDIILNDTLTYQRLYTVTTSLRGVHLLRTVCSIILY